MAILFDQYAVTFRSKDGKSNNAGGFLFFRQVGAGDAIALKSIFTASDEATEHANPVELDANGLIPSGEDVFISGQYRLTVKTAPDTVTGLSVEISNYPIIGGTVANQWAAFDSTFSYIIGDFSKAATGNYYRSKVDPNLNNTPESSPTQWERVDFNKKAIELTGGGTLTSFRVNQIQDGGTYSFPAADSLADGEQLTVEVPAFVANSFNPVLQVDGSDTIKTPAGATDTTYTFDTSQRRVRTFTSDGTSQWTI